MSSVVVPFSQILSLDLVAMPALKFSCAIVILSKAATSAAALVLISRRACDHVRPGKPDTAETRKSAGKLPLRFEQSFIFVGLYLVESSNLVDYVDF